MERLSNFLHKMFIDPLPGIILIAIFAFFLITVIIAIASSVKQAELVYAKRPNFTYLSTILVGLVLSVASGVLGKPANPEAQKVVAAQANSTSLGAPPAITTARLESLSESIDSEIKQEPEKKGEVIKQVLKTAQKESFRYLYTVTYIIVGFVCFGVFLFKEKPHSLVNEVALTTAGFCITLVGNLV